MKQKKHQVNIYLSPEQFAELNEAIAFMRDRNLGIELNRTQLVMAAMKHFIKDLKLMKK